MKKIIISALALLPVCASAQLNNTVEVESDYKPTVKDASKLNVLPQAESTQVKHYDVEYATDPKPTNSYVFQPAKAEDSAVKEAGEHKNFVTLGAGNGGRVVARGAYGWDVSDDDIINIDVALRGHKQKAPFLYDKHTKWMQRYYSTQVNGLFEHRLDTNSSLLIHAGAENQVYNFQHLPHASTTDKQHNFIFNTGADITRFELGNFILHGGINYKHFSRGNHPEDLLTGQPLPKDTHHENRFEANATAEYELNSQSKAGLELKATALTYDKTGYKNQSSFDIKPFYNYKNDELSIHVGVLLNFMGGTNKKFHVAPEVKASYALDPQIELFAEATGGAVLNDFFQFNSMTPYWRVPAAQLPSQFNQLVSNLGVKWKINEQWFTKFYAGFDITENRAELYYAAPQTIVTDVNPLIKSDIFAADGSRLHFTAEANYNLRDFFTFSAAGTYNSWGIEDNSIFHNHLPWRPELQLDAAATVQPVRGLKVGAEFKIETFAKDRWGMYKRPTTTDLSASVTYDLPSSLVPFHTSVFCKADNLLNQKYDLFYGYRTPGTSVLAGVTLNF